MNLQERLTPYDSELFRMVESLTGKEIDVLCETDGYWLGVRFTPEMSVHVKNAISAAVRGRLGERIISEKWQTDNILIYQVKYGTPFGSIVDSAEFKDGDISDSNVFYIPETSLRGLIVLETNFRRLVQFVGNGQWERNPDGTAFFHFLNASGTVYCDALEGSYLIYVKPGLYRVATKEEMSKFAMM